ncbi:jasmonate-induced oxygenase 4-like [Tasmannia lanceolata]|uniref:jasmonate-induced oxygenase 4-like n=1 Tax=Tasmannia lanceolata TaxID=3420 RepID=UPI004063A837
MEVPVISLKDLNEEKPGDEMAKMDQAMKEWECFQLIDHGVPGDAIDAFAEALKVAFKAESKTKATKESTRKGVYDNKGVPLLVLKPGYNAQGVAVFGIHNTDEEPPEDPEPADWVEQMLLPCLPNVGDPTSNWPENPLGVREKIQNYVMEMQRLAEKLLRCLAVNAGLKPETFIDAYGGSDAAAMMMVINMMPAVPAGVTTLTAPRHRDINGLNILLVVDGREGFQVMRNGKWCSVNCVHPHALLINTGDLMEVVSNGRYKSLLHRGLNCGEARLSVAAAYSPNRFKVIGPVRDLIDEKNPRLYKEGSHADFQAACKIKGVTCSEYFGI